VWLRLYSNGGWCGVRDTTCKRTPRGALASRLLFYFRFFSFFLSCLGIQPPAPLYKKTLISKLFLLIDVRIV
jgi:hypothetical protein